MFWISFYSQLIFVHHLSLGFGFPNGNAMHPEYTSEI